MARKHKMALTRDSQEIRQHVWCTDDDTVYQASDGTLWCLSGPRGPRHPYEVAEIPYGATSGSCGVEELDVCEAIERGIAERSEQPVMDPDTNLCEQLAIAERMLNDEENPDYLTDAQRLAELVVSLDTWIRNQGYLPQPWDHERRYR